MLKTFDQELYLTPISRETVDLKSSFKLPKNSSNFLLLELDLKPHKYALRAGIEIWVAGKFYNIQYFPQKVGGKRYLNLSFIDKEKDIILKTKGCSINNNLVSILEFKEINVSEETALFIAPHPDDIELSSFGAACQIKNKYIVTITTGDFVRYLETADALKMSKSFEQTTLLKSNFRAYNAFTAPLLYDTKLENSIILGYPDQSLLELSIKPNDIVDFMINKKSPNTVSIEHYRNLFNKHSALQDCLLTSPNLTGESLISELKNILDKIRPQNIFVTHPLTEGHMDHVGATIALYKALSQIPDYKPKNIFMYSIHLPKFAYKYYTAPRTIAELPLTQVVGEKDDRRKDNYESDNLQKLASNNDLKFSEGFFTIPLDESLQARKAQALMTMPDIWMPQKFSRILKQKIKSHLFKEELFGTNQYLILYMRNQEVFLTADWENFAKICQRAIKIHE